MLRNPVNGLRGRRWNNLVTLHSFVCSVTRFFHLRRDFFHSRQQDLPFPERTENWPHDGSGLRAAAASLAEVGSRTDPRVERERGARLPAPPERTSGGPGGDPYPPPHLSVLRHRPSVRGVLGRPHGGPATVAVAPRPTLGGVAEARTDPSAAAEPSHPPSRQDALNRARLPRDPPRPDRRSERDG